jgi:hypothetical protein
MRPISACLNLKMKNKQISIYKCKVYSTKLFTKYEETKLHQKLFSIISGVVDTADKHSFANISANFRKKSKQL